MRHSRFKGLVIASALALAVAGCSAGSTPKHMKPLPYRTLAQLDKMGLNVGDPILIRIFKEESELEVWKKHSVEGRYVKFKTYEICKWSGELGPKFKEGDRQAPEGFYSVNRHLMNPNSSYHLSFNIGFPNQFDRSHDRTGTHLMVHGECSSAGCYAMENDQIEEIYAMARDAFSNGQRAFQVQAFPFRMTPENFVRHASNEHMSYWRMLKEGYDHFEVTRMPPEVSVCGREYKFNVEFDSDGRLDPRAACPSYEVPQALAAKVQAKQVADLNTEAALLNGQSPGGRTLFARNRQQPSVATAITPSETAQPVAAQQTNVLTTATTQPAATPEPVATQAPPQPRAQQQATVSVQPAAPATVQPVLDTGSASSEVSATVTPTTAPAQGVRWDRWNNGG